MTKRRETYIIDTERRGLRIRDSIMEEEECLSKFIHFYDSNSFSLSLSLSLSLSFSSFFGGFGFHFGQADSGHHEIPRGGTVTLDLEVKRKRERL